MKKVLTIAGSDCSGGAGIQADIKTISAHGMYAMSAITALTAQNTTGVSGIFNVTPEFDESQLESIFTDIFPDSVKTGMMSEADIIEAAASVLKKYKAPNIVVDPVMVSTSGSRLLSDSALDAMTGSLFPLARVITPNIPEAEVLSGISISDIADMEKAARIIS
ncbi:MAG: bifunctional hydroxymethylpyrimidine kinase/phosphomethylpyrimidine kinase, partial [Oscillospiraceae bacterium]|nr:bifunctional hydroxymethylpyrimidine kinase/phosphomethylpyrimidine kinase [Oscillospiraceae bacterium]